MATLKSDNLAQYGRQRSDSSGHPAETKTRLGGDSRPSQPSGWQIGDGIVDRMLAYKDWWNIPSRRFKV